MSHIVLLDNTSVKQMIKIFIIIPIIESNHFVSSFIDLRQKIIIIMDSLYRKKKIGFFHIIFEVISIVLAIRRRKLVQNECAMI